MSVVALRGFPLSIDEKWLRVATVYQIYRGFAIEN